MYNALDYPPFAVAVDLVIFRIFENKFQVLLVERGVEPFKNSWALPGGFVQEKESVDAAALRELAEETSVEEFNGHLEQLGTYGEVDRDERMRVVSVAYWAFVSSETLIESGTDAKSVKFVNIEDLENLAFDHTKIINDGIERARAKLEYSTVATSLCPKLFTIPQLINVYETVWGAKVHKGNLRRKILATPNFVVPTGTMLKTKTRGPAAALYEKASGTLLHPPILRQDTRI